MRHPLFIPIAAASIRAIGLAGAAQATSRAGGPEAEIGKALAGRVAGKPVDCLDLNRIRSSRIIDRTAILYETDNVLCWEAAAGFGQQISMRRQPSARYAF